MIEREVSVCVKEEKKTKNLCSLDERTLPLPLY